MTLEERLRQLAERYRFNLSQGLWPERHRSKRQLLEMFVNEIETLVDQPIRLRTDPRDAPPVVVSVGHKAGMVVFQSSGNVEVEPSFISLEPNQARSVAAHLLRAADSAGGVSTPESSVFLPGVTERPDGCCCTFSTAGDGYAGLHVCPGCFVHNAAVMPHNHEREDIH